MKLAIMLDTDMNMGDHGETRKIAVEYIKGETIEELVERLGKAHGQLGPSPRRLKKWDVVEIRVVAEDL